MIRALCTLIPLIAAPAMAETSAFPNKPGKKPEQRFIIGAQSGAMTTAPKEFTVGAGTIGGQSGGGDLGLVTPTPLREKKTKRSVGYDPSARPGNKRPSS